MECGMEFGRKERQEKVLCRKWDLSLYLTSLVDTKVEKRDILSRWNIVTTSTCESCTMVFLTQIFTISFTCLLFHSFMNAPVGFLPEISSGYTLLHLLKSDSSASYVRIFPGPPKQRPSLHSLCYLLISNACLYLFISISIFSTRLNFWIHTTDSWSPAMCQAKWVE